MGTRSRQQLEEKFLGFHAREHTFSDGVKGLAAFSNNGMYRYMLTREWDSTKKPLVFILLNPSVGTETSLELTTAGCAKRAKTWNYGGIIVLNLFAFISTDPSQIKKVTDPIGRDNDGFLRSAAEKCEGVDIVAAWGKSGNHRNRDQEVASMFAKHQLLCLGQNKDGSPRHPLHMSYSIRPQLWLDAKQ